MGSVGLRPPVSLPLSAERISGMDGRELPLKLWKQGSISGKGTRKEFSEYCGQRSEIRRQSALSVPVQCSACAWQARQGFLDTGH